MLSKGRANNPFKRVSPYREPKEKRVAFMERVKDYDAVFLFNADRKSQASWAALASRANRSMFVTDPRGRGRDDELPVRYQFPIRDFYLPQMVDWDEIDFSKA